MRSQSIRTTGSVIVPAAAGVDGASDVCVDVRAPDAAGGHDRCPVSENRSCVRSASSDASSQLPDQHSSSVRLRRMLESDELVALVDGGILGELEVQARAVEVVDIAKPLAELEDDARVDGCRRRGRLELERALRGCPVEPVAEEEVGAHTGAERERDE